MNQPAPFQSLRLICLLGVATFSLFGCSESEDVEPVVEELPPIILECDYFNQPRTLVNDPQRPVDYRIGCWSRVTEALTIEPGVVIEFENHAGLLVDLDDNLFEIRGSSSEPVILTGTSKQKGFWRGLFFTEAHNHDNIIEHTIIEYAGSQNLTTSSPIYEGSLALRGVSGTPPQALTLSHVQISNGGSIGLDFHAIRKNATVTVDNVVITGNEGVPIKVSAEMAHIFDNSSSYAGNALDYFHITDQYYELSDQTVSWMKLDVPYLIERRVHINQGAHLTIEAGAQLLFHPDAYLQAAPSGNNHDLSLKILGTSSEPVELAAFDGNSWGGIYFGFTKEDNRIEHAIISQAKGDYPVGNLRNSGAIYMHADPNLYIDNTTFVDLPNYALYAYTAASASQPELPNLSLGNNTYQNVGLGLADYGYLGWGNGRDTHHPM